MAIDTKKLVEQYFDKKHWMVRENSNIPYSFSGMFFRAAGAVVEDYVLNNVYPKKITNAHRAGDMHIHNLYMGITGYCAGWSLQKLLSEGFNLPSRISSSPPKHLDTALLQMINFMGTIQNEWAGAQAFNSVDSFLAPYVEKDSLKYADVKQAIQTFVYNMNITSRWGGQTMFTNCSFDWTLPKDIAHGCQDEMDMINRAFLEVLLEGDVNQRPFTFPIPTYNITKDFDFNSENAKLLFNMTAKYGLPYFSNFINSDLSPTDIRSMCCHLRLDMRKLRKNIRGGLFGSADLTGSVGVVTINLPRIGYAAKTEDAYFEKLGAVMDLAAQSLEIKRKIVSNNIKSGFLPYSRRYLGTLENHFSTIGLIGMNEACLNFLGEDISTKDGKDFAMRTLRFMLEKLQEYQSQTGNLYNLEATPAEGCAYRLARADKKKFKKIKTAGKREPYYTNSTWLPVDKTDDPIAAIKHQEDLQALYTGGTVFHLFLGEKLESGGPVGAFIKKIFTKTKMPYLTFTPSYSICQDHGYITGEKIKCPTCGKPTEIYSRVVGYYRPTSLWNPGKQEEFRQRKRYNKKKM